MAPALIPNVESISDEENMLRQGKKEKNRRKEEGGGWKDAWRCGEVEVGCCLGIRRRGGGGSRWRPLPSNILIQQAFSRRAHMGLMA